MMEEEGPEAEFDLEDEDFLGAKIHNIALSNLGFIVMLKVNGDPRTLPIWIGTNEAQSIAIAYNNQVPPRPLTHDLLKNMLGMLDCEVIKVQVTSLADNTFFGRIYFRKEGIDDMDVDARPSDAIALAIRYKAPVFIHRDVWEAASVVMKESEEGEDVEASVASGGIEHASISAVEKLKIDLERALAEEHYEEAARLRDELKRLKAGN
jgi:uncharacterized protein